MRKLTLGISPCPNDTFIFHALIHGLVDEPDLAFSSFLEDVQQLNLKAVRKEADVIKISAAAVPAIAGEYGLLRSGGAMGRGVGPVLVASREMEARELDGARVAIPGSMTTANLLFSRFCEEQGVSPRVEEMVFDEVMDRVGDGSVAAGVLIHEGRFTYQARGLRLVRDLGRWWEKSLGLPIPLGVIAARRSLGAETARTIGGLIRKSLEYAWTHPRASAIYVLEHAQEMEESVIREHIETFVTDFSLDVGREGEEAVRALVAQGKDPGAVPEDLFF